MIIDNIKNYSIPLVVSFTSTNPIRANTLARTWRPNRRTSGKTWPAIRSDTPTLN